MSTCKHNPDCPYSDSCINVRIFYNECDDSEFYKIVNEWVQPYQDPELGDNWKQELLDAIEKQVEGEVDE